MATRIGLMGFGRIGRNIFRQLYTRDDFEVVAISDIAELAALEYLLKYDTLLGRFPHPVSVKDQTLFTYGKQIKMLNGREPGDVPWGDLKVDIVIEATARYRTRQELLKHIQAGAKKVILCVPPLDEPDITVVMGSNHHALSKEHQIISNASITAHCTLPILTLIDKAFAVERVFFSTVHAYTNDQRLADVPASSLRRSRAASENIIPTDTNSSKLLEQLLPHLKGKIDGLALNVPVPNGSLVDLTCFTQKKVSVNSVNEIIRTGIQAHYANIVEYVEDPIVSSDVKKSPYSSTFDSDATMCLGDHCVKTIAWYDNGWGYALRAIELMKYMAQKENFT